MSISESIAANPNFKVFMNNLFYPYSNHHEHSESWFSFSSSFTSLILSFTAIILFIVRLKGSKISFPWNASSSVEKGKNSRITKARLLLSVRLPIIDAIHSMIRVQRDGVKELESWVEKFGNLFELPFGPINITGVTDPTIVQKILCSSQPQHLNRPKLYTQLFGDCFHEGLITSEYDVWVCQRKMLSRSFTYKSLQNYLVFMNIQAKNLAKNLIHEAKSNKECCVKGVRVNQPLYTYSFKIIAQIVMGTDNLTPEQSDEVAQNVNRFKDLIVEKLLNPLSYKHYLWLHPKKKEYDRLTAFLNTLIDNLTEMYKKQAEQIKIDNEITNKQNSHGDREQQVPSSSIGHDGDDDDDSVGVKPFRCMIEEMLFCGASDKEIHAQVGTILGTGHETTVVATRMFMLHLALNPDVQARCREEVDNLINKKMCDNADEFSCELNMDDLQNLKYMERCIMESGRVTTIVPVFLRRLDAPLKIDDDLEFPANTNFGIFSWMMHKDPEQFPNPEKFDPDRFLPENVKKRHPYAYVPFSMGQRNCIGWKVSLMQTKVMMTWIIRHFEISSTDKLEDVKLLFGITIVPERDHNIILKRRFK